MHMRRGQAWLASACAGAGVGAGARAQRALTAHGSAAVGRRGSVPRPSARPPRAARARAHTIPAPCAPQRRPSGCPPVATRRGVFPAPRARARSAGRQRLSATRCSARTPALAAGRRRAPAASTFRAVLLLRRSRCRTVGAFAKQRAPSLYASARARSRAVCGRSAADKTDQGGRGACWRRSQGSLVFSSGEAVRSDAAALLSSAARLAPLSVLPLNSERRCSRGRATTVARRGAVTVSSLSRMAARAAAAATADAARSEPPLEVLVARTRACQLQPARFFCAWQARLLSLLARFAVAHARHIVPLLARWTPAHAAAAPHARRGAAPRCCCAPATSMPLLTRPHDPRTRQGVLTLAFTGFPPQLESLKVRVASCSVHADEASHRSSRVC